MRETGARARLCVSVGTPLATPAGGPSQQDGYRGKRAGVQVYGWVAAESGGCESASHSQEIGCRVQCPGLCSLCLRKGLETKMKARWFRTGGMLLACATLGMLGACGDDAAPPAAAGSGGAAGIAGASGGTAGVTAGRGGGGGGMTGGVMCGTATCTVNAVLKMLNPAATACCTPDTKCGQNNASGKCLPNVAPGPKDPTCPMITFMTIPVMGCCSAAAKTCGLAYDMTGFGCVPRADVDMSMGGPLPVVACGGSNDGGSPDAGL